MRSPNSTMLGLKAFFVLAVGACTYSQPTTGEPSEETSGSGGMTGASSTSSSSGLGLASGTSSSSSGDAGSTSSSSSSSSGNATSSSTSSSSTSSSSSGGPATPTVHCGANNMDCKTNIVTQYGCCYDNGSLTCEDLLTCPGFKFYCDGAEDCAPGFVCCLSPDNKLAVCVATNSCNGNLSTICNDDTDCPVTKDCDPATYGTIGKCAN